MDQSEYERLVAFLGQQFTAIDHRFTAMDGRFTAMEDRFVAMEDRFVAMEDRFVAMDGRFAVMEGQLAVMDGRFAVVEGRFTAVDGQFTAIGHHFAAIDARFDRVDAQIADLRREMLGHFDEIYRRLERLENEYQAITQTLRRIEARLADETGRREILARDLGELKRQVAALQSRIEDIEDRLGR